jgi:threonine synthase
MDWQQRLAREEGLYVEPASAGALSAVAQLRDIGTIAATDKVVALLTASGLKDPAATAATQGDVLTIPGDVGAAFDKLRAMKLIPE